MVIPAWRPRHVPLTAWLPGNLVVDATAKASPHLVIRVLIQVFRQVAGALTPSDCRDHSGIRWVCLSHGNCRRRWDHEVTWNGGWWIGCKWESRERQGGEVVFSHPGVPAKLLEGTAIRIKVFHGPIHGFVDCEGQKNEAMYFLLLLFLDSTCYLLQNITLILLINGSSREAGRERNPG